MLRERLRSGIRHVGLALREPEEFAVQWHRGEGRYPLVVWAALLVTAILGTTTYGMTMGLLGGADDVLRKALLCTLGAGLAWPGRSLCRLSTFSTVCPARNSRSAPHCWPLWSP